MHSATAGAPPPLCPEAPMSPSRRPLPLAFATAAVLAAGALAPSSAHAAKDKIVVGATLPLTGAEARVGGFFKEGYDLAFEEVNKKGGLEVGGKKLPVQLILQDDTSTQATAVSLADRLVNSDKVDFLLGTYASHLVEAQSRKSTLSLFTRRSARLTAVAWVLVSSWRMSCTGSFFPPTSSPPFLFTSSKARS